MGDGDGDESTGQRPVGGWLYHTGGTIVVMLDGPITFIEDSVDSTT
ncbi:hypothetical protein [Aquisphaera giovannonii]|nr:hypothetical protein [Aquisphaera giovannonii]